MSVPSSNVDVLVDLTPLDSAVRYRGIGRYVDSLRAALAALPEDERAGLQLGGMTDLAGPRIDRALRWSGDPAFRTYPGCHHVYRWRRSLFLDRAARRSGARLWHHTDPTGTPLRPRRPYVVTCHDLIPLVLHDVYLPRRGAREKQRRIDGHRYGQAVRVIAISESTRGDLIEQLGIDPARIDVVPSGVDGELFSADSVVGEQQEVRRALGIERPFVLYVGGADERKNVPHLVRAFARSGVAGDVDLVIAGDVHRTQLPSIAEAVDDVGVAASVRVSGHVADAVLAAAYRQCVVHVCPSLYEGFGLTVAEAMACGAPTITTAGGSLGEVAGNAAFLIEGVDVDETADAIRRFVADADLRATFRAAGLDRVREFTWSATARGTVAAYRRALNTAVS